MSLRTRVVVALAVLAAVATGAVGAIGYVTTRDRLLEEVDRSLVEATASLRPGRDGGFRVPVRGLLDVFVQVIGPGGEVIDARADSAFPPGTAALEIVGRPGEVRFETVATGRGDLRVRTESYGPAAAAVQVARSLAETDSVLADLRRRTALIVALVTAAAAALGWVLAGSVVRPLVRLTRAATAVERSGQLDVAVPVTGGGEVGRLGAAFNGMLAALAASRADQRRLVEDAGHELRTPLTSVRTNLAVLRRHPDLDPATRAEVLDDLHAETEQLVGLTEEVVDLARGASDDTPVSRVRLGDVARAVAARARRRHERAVTVTADDSIVEAPPPAVERAIANLVDNAVKFSAGPVDVEVAAGHVTVHDRGSGIATADVDHVFDRFYRAAAARSRPGSGLGLSIVRDVAERHGGTVHAGPRPGGGASVGFGLPLAPPDLEP